MSVSISFTFPSDLNISLQEGDIAYYAATTVVSGESGGDDFNTAPQNSIVRIGPVTSVSHATNSITCSVDDDFYMDTNSLPFVFFGKDSRVNTGSIIGYYANAKFRNTSSEKGINKGEMFAASCDVFDSSK